jgi:methionyl-tRNA synthetase
MNADLANDLGNFAQRSLTMLARNLNGRIPAPGSFSDEDSRLLAAVDGLLAACRAAFNDQQIHLALNAIWAVVAEANRHFAAAAPWELRKTDPARMATVLYVAAEVLRHVAILAQPVMPGAMGRLLDLLAVPADGRSFAALGAGGRIAPGTALPTPSAIFPRYVEKVDAEAAR